MILVGEILVSSLVVESRFACRLDDCGGACCREGERGSPLKAGEAAAISEALPRLLDRLPQENGNYIRGNGFFLDEDGRRELLCLPDGRCVFAVEGDTLPGCCSCAMEQLYLDQPGSVEIRKPGFCHLFPLRLEYFYGRTCLNMEHRQECATSWGSGPLVVEFAEDALVAEFGRRWYEELLTAVRKERRRLELDDGQLSLRADQTTGKTDDQ